MKPYIPVASASTEELADWLELNAMLTPDRPISRETLINAIRISGSIDAIGDVQDDSGAQLSQQIADDAFIEFENRNLACGGSDLYPFGISLGNCLSTRNAPKNSIYKLLLLMSFRPPTGGHNGTAVLFERICTEAARGYFGGNRNLAQAIRFGAPRKPPISKIRHALDDLCKQIAEGGGCKHPSRANHTGDDGLDIVAWRHFPDQREGKLIAFGQCAAGESNWQEKLMELDGAKFCKKWLRDIPIVDPIRMFFLPRRVPKVDWEHSGIDGGILFDRCRIVASASDLNDDLIRECEQAVRKLIKGAPK